MLAGVRSSRNPLARAGARRRRGDLRPARRPVRGQWRLGARAGALRRLSHPRRAGRRAHAALPWHLHRHRRPDHHPLLSHPSRKGPGHSGRHQDLGLARHRRGRVQRGDRGVCAGGGADAGVRRDRHVHRHQAVLRRRPLESWTPNCPARYRWRCTVSASGCADR